LCADALAFRPAVMLSAGRPAAERAWLTSARTWAAAPPDDVPAGFVAEAADVGDAGRADADADAVGDDRGWWCLVRAADGLGDSEAGTLATAAWKGCPAQEPTDPAADGSQGEGAHGAAVAAPVADAGAGPRPPRVR
jgi:hypothetical protein